MAFAASLLLGGEQAHAASSKYDAAIYDSVGYRVKSYTNLQDALNEVQDDQEVRLRRNINTSKEFVIDKEGVRFELNLAGYALTGYSDYIVHIVNGDVTIRDTGQKGTIKPMKAHYVSRCFLLDNGGLHFNVTSGTQFSGGRVADVYGGELTINNGIFKNSIVCYNSDVRILIYGGFFDKNVNISAKGENACHMEISGGEFFANITNTGKTGFITGGTFSSGKVPVEQYIHPSYHKVEDSILKGDKTYKAYISVSIEGWASGEDAKTPTVIATFDANKAVCDYKAKGASDDACSDAASTASPANTPCGLQSQKANTAKKVWGRRTSPSAPSRSPS